MKYSEFIVILLLFYSEHLIQKFLNSTDEDTRALDELFD